MILYWEVDKLHCMTILLLLGLHCFFIVGFVSFYLGDEIKYICEEFLHCFQRISNFILRRSFPGGKRMILLKVILYSCYIQH